MANKSTHRPAAPRPASQPSIPPRITQRVKSEASKVLGDRNARAIDRSLAGEVLRQAQIRKNGK